MKTNAFNGNPVKILIITDRLHEYAESLYNFFSDFQDVECNLIYSAEEFNDKMNPPDFLLTAGRFKNKKNYRIVEQVCSKNKAACCILLGIIDDCIIYHGQANGYHDCFERRLPNEALLTHLQKLQNQRLNGFQYETFNQCCNIIYNHNTYNVTACSNEEIIKLADLGIYPPGPESLLYAPYITYDDLYCITNNTLTLIDLRIYESRGVFPIINGVSPISFANGHVYKRPNIPILFTGTLFLSRDKKQIGNSKYNNINTMFGYKELLKITLDKGQVISCEDMGNAVKKARSLYKCMPILKYKKHLTPIQEYFLERYTGLPMPNARKLLFDEYEKFLSNM